MRRTIDHLRKPENPDEAFDERLHGRPTDASENPRDHESIQWVAKAVDMLASKERILIDLIFRSGHEGGESLALLLCRLREKRLDPLRTGVFRCAG